MRHLILLMLVLVTSCVGDARDRLSNSDHEQPFQVAFRTLSRQYKQEKAAAVDQFFKKYWLSNQVSGAFLVAKNGQIIYEAYKGCGSFERRDSIKAETPIHIASVSKVLTAALIMRLKNEGLIQLDDDVSKYLKPFPYLGMTVRHLLTHRSGLANYAYLCDEKEIWDKRNRVKNSDVLAIFNKFSIPLQGGIGKRFAYCNTNYVFLALIAEQVTQKSYPVLMQEYIFGPLGMKHSFVMTDDLDKEAVCQSYKGNRMRLAFDHLDDTYGDKNIYSTPRDLLLFDKATYSDDFFTDADKQEIYRGYSYESRGTRNYGIGIRLYEWKTGEKMFYHNGWWHGNTSSYVTLRKDSVCIIALSNKYSKVPYQSFKLASAFGNYPIDGEAGE
ncbi:serine hydrolase domain-containing protein [Flavobacterium sp.]|uniref:serine hydrolase domain-containing protein n=1 Tax=Flavobacterium sp. TaxID=239 RepID=UPI00262F46D2|nr:serine hydrolase domain-containing protein [Flavobacterium sp.]